jgi:hypothetical protein
VRFLGDENLDFAVMRTVGDGILGFAACVAIDCAAIAQPNVGNRLMFEIDLDQTELPEILRGSTPRARRYGSSDGR